MKLPLLALGFAACLALSISAEEHTPLGEQMETFNDVYKAIRKESDPAKGAALARDAQKEMIKALAETPEVVAKMPEGTAKTKSAAEYRMMIGRVFVSLCEIEVAFLDGKTEEVSKIVASLKEMKKEGHDKFMEE
jgi:hypothetical protein